MEVKNIWRKCSSCKKDILLNTKYYECSVSTCTGQRTGYVFCSIPCWEVHLPGARHRDAGAVEKKSPSQAVTMSPNPSLHLHPTSGSTSNSGLNPSSNAGASLSSSPQRRIIVNSNNASVNAGGGVSLSRPAGIRKSSMANEILVVVSKMKQYIRDISDMNTSEEVSQKLSEMIRVECDKAVENAKADGRKTVMARDFK